MSDNSQHDFNRGTINSLEEQGKQLLKGMDLDAVKAELASLRDQFDKAKGTVKEKAVVVDSHVHANPYPYVLGALGIGLLAGGVLMKGR